MLHITADRNMSPVYCFFFLFPEVPYLCSSFMWSTNSPLLSSAIQILKLKSSAVNLKMRIPLVDTGCRLICLTFSLILSWLPPPCRAHICPYCRRSRYAPESLSRLHKCYHNTDGPQIHSRVPLHLHCVCQCIPFSKPEQPCWF